MKRMKDRNKMDRLREKLAKKGPGALSDLELLQALIGSGSKNADVGKIAKDTLKLLQKHGADITHERLQSVTGLGTAKITEILAAFELSNRYLGDSNQPTIDSAEKAVEQLADIRDKKQEYFVVMTLDGANRLIEKRTITIGTLTASLVHPREVFADAITDRAATVMLAHNHPSGDPTPSKADMEIHKRLTQASVTLGIDVFDHIIVTKTAHSSINKHKED